MSKNVTGGSLSGYGSLDASGTRASSESTLSRFFSIQARGSTVAREVRAGTASFLTISYILLVNPSILGYPNTGIARDDVVMGTAIGSIVGSIFCGIFANLPFTMAPGLGLSAYFAYGLVQGQGLAWEGALCCCTIAGMMMLVLAVTNLSNLIMTIIPNTIKVATVVGMGLLLTMIGMQKIGIVVASNDESLVKLGELSADIYIALFGLALLGTLAYRNIKGSILVGILAVTLIVWTKDDSWPQKYVSLPNEKDFSEISTAALSFGLIDKRYWGGIASFMVVGIFDVSGVLFGLSRMAKLSDENGEIPGCKWAFTAAALGTIVAALFGCSPIIPAIESAAGIQEGGRTGLTAVVSGLWFFVALFLAPLFGDIPVLATSPVLILIGASMMGEASEIDWSCMYQALPAFLTLTIMPFTFSIPNGIIFGTLFLILLYFTTGQFWNKSSDGVVDTVVQEEHSPILKHAQDPNEQVVQRKGSFRFVQDVIGQPTYVRKMSTLMMKDNEVENTSNFWSHAHM